VAKMYKLSLYCSNLQLLYFFIKKLDCNNCFYVIFDKFKIIIFQIFLKVSCKTYKNKYLSKQNNAK